MGWWRRGKKKILKKQKKKKKIRRRRGKYIDKDGVKKGLFRGKRRVLMKCLCWVDKEEEGKRFSKKEEEEGGEERGAEIERR